MIPSSDASTDTNTSTIWLLCAFFGIVAIVPILYGISRLDASEMSPLWLLFRYLTVYIGAFVLGCFGRVATQTHLMLMIAPTYVGMHVWIIGDMGGVSNVYPVLMLLDLMLIVASLLFFGFGRWLCLKNKKEHI